MLGHQSTRAFRIAAIECVEYFMVFALKLQPFFGCLAPLLDRSPHGLVVANGVDHVVHSNCDDVVGRGRDGEVKHGTGVGLVMAVGRLGSFSSRLCPP